MSETIKVGDVVTWDKVPDGALVREEDGDERGAFTVKVSSMGYVVKRAPPRALWLAFEVAEAWEWDGPEDVERATIVALGLTGQESADDLRRLAEVFEVREALLAGVRHVTTGMTHVVMRYFDDDAITMAERLHAAGWRPGMTAEDAARLLAAKEST